ncbi:MAG: cyanophycin synthetase [Acidobacteriota bacterium]
MISQTPKPNWLKPYPPTAKGRSISFGFKDGADFQADRVEIVNLHQTRFRLRYKDCDTIAVIPMAGAHFIVNALPGIALGQLYGLKPEQIISALSDLKAASMRGRILNFREGFTIIDDSYNSNPEALKGMIEMLTGVPGFKRRILVAGEMLELGPSSKSLHYKCGLFAAHKNLEVVIGVRGDAQEIVQGSRRSGMKESHTRFFSQPSEASEFLKKEIRDGDLVLVKGSRGVRMETVIQNLRSVFECET